MQEKYSFSLRIAAGIAFFCFSQALPVLSPGVTEAAMSNIHKLDRPEILQVMFHPRSEARNGPPAQAQDIDIQVDPGVSIGCRLFTADKQAPVILFFHGNGEIVTDYDDIGPRYIDEGVNFLAADYRGYGWSGGTPSVVSLIGDARTLFKSVTGWLAEHGYTGKIFVMGRSLGSACAIDLALEFQETVSGLILESAFAETIPLMRTLGLDLTAMDITEKDCFGSLDKIGRITTPTYILHGQRDSLIPLRHAQQLHAASGARTKELQIVPGADHNTVIAMAGILYFQAIRGFIDKVTGRTGWRERRKRFRQRP